MKITYLFLIFICTISYIHLILKQKKDFQILQTYLINCNPDLLLEKYPIIIQDQIHDIQDLFDSIFKYQYITKSFTISKKKQLIINKNKFCVIYNTNKTEVCLTLFSNDTPIEIKLLPFTVCILPFWWSYMLDTNGIEIYKLNDLIHFLLYGYFD